MARLTLAHYRAKGAARLLRIAPLRNCLCDVRFEFFIDLAIYIVSAKDIPDPRPEPD